MVGLQNNRVEHAIPATIGDWLELRKSHKRKETALNALGDQP
jgi:hypothetical protein